MKPKAWIYVIIVVFLLSATVYYFLQNPSHTPCHDVACIRKSYDELPQSGGTIPVGGFIQNSDGATIHMTDSKFDGFTAATWSESHGEVDMTLAAGSTITNAKAVVQECIKEKVKKCIITMPKSFWQNVSFSDSLVEGAPVGMEIVIK